MHLIHQNVPALCWEDPKDPPILKTNTGRQRLNILGAYNPDSHSFIHLTGEENCDANRVIEYYEVIIRAYRRAPKIILYIDNARYFKAAIVSKWLEDHPKLQIAFLPPYAPNLNLIERFWRFVKTKLVKNIYYKKHKIFRAKAFQLLNQVGEHVDESKSLMVEKFQIVKTSIIYAKKNLNWITIIKIVSLIYKLADLYFIIQHVEPCISIRKYYLNINIRKYFFIML